jgi:hypothetical protein
VDNQLVLRAPADVAALSGAEAGDALVPLAQSVDEALLARREPLSEGVVAWGPRPPESSAYDQLVLSHPECVQLHLSLYTALCLRMRLQ